MLRKDETLMILEGKNCFIQQQQKQKAHILHEACSAVVFDGSLMMSVANHTPPTSRTTSLMNNLKSDPVADMDFFLKKTKQV